MLFIDVTIAEVDAEGQPVTITKTTIDSDTRRELIRSITKQNNDNDKKHRMKQEELKAAIQGAIEAARLDPLDPHHFRDFFFSNLMHLC